MKDVKIEDLKDFLDRMDYGPGGKAWKVREGGNWGSGLIEWVTVEPHNRYRLDHYGNNGDGWDDEAWTYEYSEPMEEAAQKQLDRKFGKGLFNVSVGEKGYVYVRWNDKKVNLILPPDMKRKAGIGIEEYNKLLNESGGDTQSYMSVQALHSMKSHSEGLLELIDENTPLPDWVEYKLAQSSGMLTAIYEYMVHGVLKRASSTISVLEKKLERLFGEKTKYLNGKFDFLNDTDDLFEIFVTEELEVKMFINKHLYLNKKFNSVNDAFKAISKASNPHL